MYMPICRNTACSTHMLCSTYRNIYIACRTTCLWYHVLHRTRSPCAYIYISYPLIQTISYMHMTAGIHYIIWFRGVCMCIYTHARAPLKTVCIQLADTSMPRVHALTHRSKWTTCARSWCCTQGQDLNRVLPRPYFRQSMKRTLVFFLACWGGGLVISRSAAITSRV